MSESDGIEEALSGTMTVALATAARLAEQMARQREAQLRNAAQQDRQRAHELQQRMNAERDAARPAYAAVTDDRWWQTADPREVVRRYELASTWRDVDPQAARAAERIEQEARDRYGADIAADPEAVAQAQTQRDVEDRSRNEARTQRAESAEDVAVGATLAGAAAEEQEAADRDHQASLHEHHETIAQDMDEQSEVAYDSHERRQDMAASLDGVADAATVDARVRADIAQGRPAAEAVLHTGRAPKARKARQPQLGREHERPGLGR